MKDEIVQTSKSACTCSRAPPSDKSSPMTASKAPTDGFGCIAQEGARINKRNSENHKFNMLKT